MINTSTVAQLPIAAFNLVNTEFGRKISLQHTTAFVFSEELAREGLHHYLNPLNRYRETRGTTFVLVCRGKARDFLKKNMPPLEVSPAKQVHLFLKSSKLNALVHMIQFREFYQDTKSISREPVTPLVAISEKGLNLAGPPELDKLGDFLAGDMPSDKGEVQFIGSAVFKGDKMVGELTGDETRYLNMITGHMELSFLVVSDPEKKGEPVGINLRQARKPKIKVRFTPETPVIEVEIYQEPEIVGVGSGINYESTELKPVLEKALEDIIRERCEKLVARSQDEFRADIFGLGRYASKNFLTRSDWEKFHWEKVYPMARVEIKVHVKIRRTGLMLKTQPVHY
ncbi:MAG: Ger(x)C family spore germination protein [Firmicutes bacterium]|nr:Ger(x)C family spore germination protein [Bacillota bacterium]